MSVKQKRVARNAIAAGNKKGTLTNQSACERDAELLGSEDRVLGGLGHAELHNLLGRDLDGGAGGRVTADAGLAVHEDQLAEPGKGEAVLGILVGELGNVIEDFDGLLLGDAGFFSDRSSDLRFGQCFGHILGSLFLVSNSRETWPY